MFYRLSLAFALMLLAGCSSKAPIREPSIKLVSEVKPKLPGCVTPPQGRPSRETGGKFWSAVREIDALLAPEPDPNTGITPSPQYWKAWILLEPLVQDCPWCNASERWQLYQRAAVAHFYMDDKISSIKYFNKVLDLSPAIPVALETQTLYAVAKMLVELEDYQQALKYFDRWESMCPHSVPPDYRELRNKAEKNDQG